MVRKTISVTIDPELLEEMKKAAKESGRTISGFIEYSVRQELNKKK